MNIWALLLFCSFLIYFYSGIYVLRLNKKSIINRCFFIICINLSFWAFGYTFMITAENEIIANYWRLFSALGWCFFYSSWLYFSLVLTNKNGVFRSRWFIAALYIPSVFFFINTATYPAHNFLKTPLGWLYIYKETVFFSYAFNVYYLIFVVLGILLIYFWGKKSKILREKRQARIITITTIVTLLFGALTDTILPKLNISIIPVAILFFVIFIIGIWYSVTKYKMLSLTPEVAADYILKTMMDPVIFIDNNLLIKEVNKAVMNITGYDEDEIKGKTIRLLVSDLELNEVAIHELFHKKSVKNLEVELSTKGDNKIPCLFSGAVMNDDLGEVIGIVCVFHDITDRKGMENFLKISHIEMESRVRKRTMELEITNQALQSEIYERKIAEEKINYIAYHDSLTGLPNRILYNERLNQAIYQMQRNNKLLAVMFLDIDNFKLINDTLGHIKGDMLLQQFVNRINSIIRKSDTLARIGGDEFLLYATNLDEKNDINTILDKTMSVLNEPFVIDSVENFITVSIGVAFYPQDGRDSETLIRNADIAMYEAKNTGRNNYKLCSFDMKTQLVERAKLKNCLYRALEKRELSVYYQPQINLKSNSISGFEALLRWKFNGEYFIPPSEFIPIAEETGLIVPIGYWVIKMVCSTLKRWHNNGFPDLCMAVNVSSKQLMQNNFVNQVTSILKETDLGPEFLEFEITERVTLNGVEDTIKVLEEFKNIGIKISIDDFGIDYSSFMNIKRLPIDKIKIAMQFIQELNQNNKDAAIVSSIIGLSHNLGLKVIAEGVETNEQLQYLHYINCDEVQGYYYYKPMPGVDVDKILNIDTSASS